MTVAAAVLTRADLAGGTYVLTGSEAVGYGGIADSLTRMLDRPVQYIDLPPHELRQNLVDHAHMPPWLAEHILEIPATCRLAPGVTHRHGGTCPGA